MLTAFKFGNNEKLVDYISFALTITSLFLALVSIIYAFYSNSTLSQNLTIMNVASNQVSETSLKLAELTTSLGVKIESIPDLIKILEVKVDKTHELMQEAYEKGIVPPVSTDANLSDETVSKFFMYASPMGLYGLYAAYLGYTTGKNFRLTELEKASPMLGENYTYGFLVACSSFGFFKRANYSDDIEVTGFHDNISSQIEDAITHRAEQMDDAATKYLHRQRKLIRKFFDLEEEKE